MAEKADDNIKNNEPGNRFRVHIIPILGLREFGDLEV